MVSDESTARDALARRTEQVIRQLLDVIIPDDMRRDHPHLQDTPRRVTSWLLQYARNGTSPDDILQPIFNESYTGMVLVKDIEFSSLCAHHFLPFKGKAAVGYIPSGKVIGLSKLARIVHYYAERVTIQELITQAVVRALDDALKPTFVAAYLYDVEHGCMTIRGVREPHARTDTFDARGRDVFISQFMGMIR